MHYTSALFTDRYELTMIEAALTSGTAHRRSIFEVFARNLKGERRYGVVAGTGRFLEQLKRFRFQEPELQWLQSAGVVGSQTLDWLSDFRFSGNIWGYREGEVFFPGSPVLVVDATFAEGVLLETMALSILNADSAVATAASRMSFAAQGKPIAEMGSRRTGEYSAVAAARAAYIAGFTATSNLEAGRSYGIPTMGTASHAFTLLHDSERQAFSAQLEAHGAQTTLLVDTYNIAEGVQLAVELAGPKLGAVRIDSGDLPVVVAQVREQLDSLGAAGTKVTVTNDLDEFTVAALASGPVDSFGVGTSVVTGSGSPTMGMVYKLVALQDETGAWRSVAKNSENKASRGGRKTAHRRLNSSGIATAEEILIGPTPGEYRVEGRARRVLTPLVEAGEIPDELLGKAAISAARDHHFASVSELPAIAMSLTRGEPALETTFIEH